MTSIIMIGATGLVGGTLARMLVARGHQVTTVGRRACAIAGVQDLVAPVEEWPAAIASVHAEAAISALGTTIKAAGSQAAFAAIDRDAVVTVAKAARARQWLMISSVGANPASRSFYLRVKGQAEIDVAATGRFERIDIFQPGLLLGLRHEHRPGEAMAQRLASLLGLLARGPLERYGPNRAEDVATAIAATIGATATGVHFHRNGDMRRLVSGPTS